MLRLSASVGQHRAAARRSARRDPSRRALRHGDSWLQGFGRRGLTSGATCAALFACQSRCGRVPRPGGRAPHPRDDRRGRGHEDSGQVRSAVRVHRRLDDPIRGHGHRRGREPLSAHPRRSAKRRRCCCRFATRARISNLNIHAVRTDRHRRDRARRGGVAPLHIPGRVEGVHPVEQSCRDVFRFA